MRCGRSEVRRSGAVCVTPNEGSSEPSPPAANLLSRPPSGAYTDTSHRISILLRPLTNALPGATPSYPPFSRPLFLTCSLSLVVWCSALAKCIHALPDPGVPNAARRVHYIPMCSGVRSHQIIVPLYKCPGLRHAATPLMPNGFAVLCRERGQGSRV